MPCHSAHVWFNEVKNAVTIPFYSIIENTVQTILEQKIQAHKKIVVLATKTTINSGLYQKAFKNSPFKIITPRVEEQQVVDNAIKSVKTGKLKTNPYIPKLNQFLKNYKNKGVSMLLGCCTEVPLMFPYLEVDIEMLDPTLMLAQMAIKKAMS